MRAYLMAYSQFAWMYEKDETLPVVGQTALALDLPVARPPRGPRPARSLTLRFKRLEAA
jgi:hypothetical protein